MIRTIGHSTHPIERFVDLLKQAGVKLLVDVRSMPYSRRFPQFSRAPLTKSLSDAGIDYVWEGESLGGKPRAARAAFEEGLSRVLERSADTALCLMCAEKEPLECHRTILVSRGLAERGAAVEHLLADGTRRAHKDVEETLLGRSAGDLFEDRAQRLARAYDARDRAMLKL